MRRALSAVVLLATAACAPDDLLAGAPQAGCVGDAMEACLCADGATSTRTCQSDGTFAACACADAGGALDAAAPDAPRDAALPDARADVVALDAPFDVTALDAPRPDVVSIDAPRPDVVRVDATAPDAPRPDASIDVPGCDADLATSPLHCGACGRACASGEVCTAGRCVVATPVCPPVCATSADCAACSRPGDPGAYCCMSSVCVYVSTAVCAAPPDAAGGSDVMMLPEGSAGDAPSGDDATPMLDAGGTGPG